MSDIPRRTDLAGRLEYLERMVNDLTRRSGASVTPPDPGAFTGHVVNVKDMGAVGDGTTDDREAFLAAADTGKVTFVPAGQYLISGVLPDSWIFGDGTIVDDNGEVYVLDRSVPTKINTTMVGDGHRNNLIIGQNAGSVLGPDSGANVALGQNALTSSVSGQRNTALGSGAMKLTTTGSKSVAVGTDAGFASTFTDSSTYVGSNAGKWAGDTDPLNRNHDFFANGPSGATMFGIDAPNRWPTVRDFVGGVDTPLNVATGEVHNQENIGIGRNSLLHAVRATENTVVGYNAMAHGYNVTGNVAVGQGALRDGINANFCVAVGDQALNLNASGPGNTAVGTQALALNTHSAFNVAVGFGALRDLTGTHTVPSTAGARRNTAVGPEAMRDSTDGFFNCAFGSQALLKGTGNSNLAVGSASLAAATTGSGNTGCGHNTLGAVTTGGNNTAVGFLAGGTVTAQGNTVAVGANTQVTDNRAIAVGSGATAGNNGIALGYTAAAGAGAGAVAIGYAAVAAGTTSTAVGFQATTAAFTNAAALGNGATVSANNMIRVGNSSVSSIGGQVGWTTVSDLRDKTDVEDTQLGLQFIQTLRPVDYRYRPRDTGVTDPRMRHGFLAQDIQQAGTGFGGVVDDDPDHLAVTITDLIGPLTKAVQELATQLSEAQATIAELKGNMNHGPTSTALTSRGGTLNA